MAIQTINNATFQAAVQGETPTLVMFYSEWCNTCREMTGTLETLAAEYNGRLRICRIDFDNNLDASVAHGVMVVPTTFLFKDGQSIERMAGLQSREALLNKIGRYLGG